MKVIAYTSPARGHVYPVVPTLIELRDRGHEVAVRTLASEVANLRGLGLGASAISPLVEGREMDDWRATNPLAQLKRALAAFVDRAEHEVPDLTEAIQLERPDLLLVDVNSWGAQAVAEASDIPWAVYAPYPLPIPSRYAPPFGLGLKPMAGRLGRLRDRSVTEVSMLSWNRVLPRLNEVRAAAGAERFQGVGQVFGRAPLTIAFTAEPFEYPRLDWPSSVRLVGPSLWEPADEAPAWIGDLQKPLVLVSTSTEFQADDRLLQVALDALAGEPVTVIATSPIGSRAALRIPANARVEAFVPHGPILKFAVCVVCHGGMGTTQKALAAGVPVCVVPFGRDQPEVARRVEVAHAGTRLPAARLNAMRLRRAVGEAMTMSEGAARIASAFAAAGGAPAAADALEKAMS
ncbi:MAG: glycosyltransferase [Candidatus Dormibacteraceae bacterium]